MLVILYGTLGAGKSTLGARLSEKHGWHFYDADEHVLPDMQSNIAARKTFPQALRDRYYALVGDHIAAKLEQHEHVVVAQAMIKQSNRLDLLRRFPKARFVAVTAAPQVIDRRVRLRANAVTTEYAKKVLAEFERTESDHEIQNVDLEQALLALESLLELPAIPTR